MKKKSLFGLNVKQRELWSDKLMDAANYLLTGVLLAWAFSDRPNWLNVLIAFLLYVIIGKIATNLRR